MKRIDLIAWSGELRNGQIYRNIYNQTCGKRKCTTNKVELNINKNNEVCKVKSRWMVQGVSLNVLHSIKAKPFML